MKEASLYEYSTLQTDQIRVFSLLPGSFEDAIVIRLKTISIGPNSSPNYEALSYVWGCSDHPQRVFVESDSIDDVSQQARLQYVTATHNLSVALRWFRSTHVERTFWVDAICINQTHVEERNTQVKLMPKIYGHALRTTIWLDPETILSDGAMRLFRKWAMVAETSFDGAWSLRCRQGYHEEYAWINGDGADEIPDASTKAAILDILYKEWFERLWVRQELFMSLGRAVVQYGQQVMPWEDFRTALIIVRLRIDIPGAVFEKRKRLIDDILQNQLFHAAQKLSFSRNLKCLDPRDHVFGILGSLGEGDQWLVDACPPDYSLSRATLYRNVAMAHISEHSELGILSHCHFSHENQDLPSWVPDWSRPSKVMRSLWRFHAGAGTKMEIISNDNPNVLALRGKQVAIVAAVAAESVQSIGAILRWYVAQTGSMSMTDKLESVARAIVPSLSVSHRTQADHVKYLDSIVTDLAHIEEGTADEDLLNSYNQRLIRQLPGRALAFTDGHKICIAPFGVRVNDVFAVLLGSDFTMCLRPRSDDSFAVVGPLDYHDFDTGQALVGEMPKDWRLRTLLSADLIAFEYLPTGGLTTLDPRIDWDRLRSCSAPEKYSSRVSFQREWETLQDDSDNYWAQILNRNRLGQLRRPDESYLKQKHGVELRTFELI